MTVQTGPRSSGKADSRPRDDLTSLRTESARWKEGRLQGQTHLLHVGLLGEGHPGDGVGRDAQLLSIHLALFHLHDACRGRQSSATCLRPAGATAPTTTFCTRASTRLNLEARASQVSRGKDSQVL